MTILQKKTSGGYKFDISTVAVRAPQLIYPLSNLEEYLLWLGRRYHFFLVNVSLQFIVFHFLGQIISSSSSEIYDIQVTSISAG